MAAAAVESQGSRVKGLGSRGGSRGARVKSQGSRVKGTPQGWLFYISFQLTIPLAKRAEYDDRNLSFIHIGWYDTIHNYKDV